MTMPALFTGHPVNAYGPGVNASGGNYRQNAGNFRGGTLQSEAERRRRRLIDTQGQYDAAAGDPRATTSLFGDIFGQAANAITAPALRGFRDQQDARGANVASRFGGNVSGEELRQTGNAQDTFSRNLFEMLGGLVPQQVAAGQRYTDQLGERAGNAQSGLDQSLNDLLASLGMQSQDEENKARRKGKGLLGTLGGLAGTAAGAFLGGPAGAAAGGSLFGGI